MDRIHNRLLKEAILHIALNVEGLWKGYGEESSYLMHFVSPGLSCSWIILLEYP